MDIQLNGIKLHYQMFGSGKPIIFLHGQSRDHHDMVDLFEPCFKDKDWMRLYLDLPGHGLSGSPDWINTQDQILDVLLEFIDTVIPEQPFAVAGLSYGCYLAQGIVHKKSSLATGLLMVVPVVLTDRSKRDLPPHVTIVKDDEVYAKLSDEEKPFFDNFVVVQSEHALNVFRNEPASTQLYNTEFMGRIEENRAFSFAIDDVENKFEKPVLMLMGRQDSVVGYRDTWKVIEKYPRATFVVLDKAGHGLGGLEQVALSEALINEWIDRIEEQM